MEQIQYGQILQENFGPSSLDGFIRRQEVSSCWRKTAGQWRLLPIAYTEDWNAAQRRSMAEALLRSLRAGGLAYGAWAADRVVGFALLDKNRFGSAGQYVDLAEFYVSQPFRGRGIGRVLFRMAGEGAKALGASRLYISAHSARESIAAYRALGCVEAEEINWPLARKEPCDVQLEYRL